jgi:hypothetical protein
MAAAEKQEGKSSSERELKRRKIFSLSFLSFPAGVKLRIRADEQGNGASLDL